MLPRNTHVVCQPTCACYHGYVNVIEQCIALAIASYLYQRASHARCLHTHSYNLTQYVQHNSIASQRQHHCQPHTTIVTLCRKQHRMTLHANEHIPDISDPFGGNAFSSRGPRSRLRRCFSRLRSERNRSLPKPSVVSATCGRNEIEQPSPLEASAAGGLPSYLCGNPTSNHLHLLTRCLRHYGVSGKNKEMCDHISDIWGDVPSPPESDQTGSGIADQ